MAVACTASSGANTTTTTTSLTKSFNCAGGNLLVVAVNTRLGCTTSDTTGFSCTYNGVTMSFAKGSADTTVNDGAFGECHHGRVMYLASPASGANDIVASWTGSAKASMVVYAFSGASATLGTITEASATGTSWTATATIGASDMLLGFMFQTYALSTITCTTGSNFNKYADSSDEEQTAGATNTGTGSISVSGACSNSRKTTLGIPILAASSTAIKTINGLAVASVKTVNGLSLASVKTVNGLA